MSHTTTIKSIQINSVSALYAATERLKADGIKCSLHQNKKPRMYYDDQHGVCPYVLQIEGCRYDVGFDQRPDGALVPVFDTWNNYIGKTLGVSAGKYSREEAAIGKLTQAYAIEAAIESAVNAGHFVESCTIDSRGEVQMLIQLNN